MKNRFSTLDLCASIAELQEKYQGMRVMNIYDVDNKTYLIKLARPEKKAMILIESGIRIHSTDFEWPKNITPSSFSMKLRKHLRTRRLETITQLGVDRIIDIQFGSNEAAYHIILELYDRGNIVLTDHEYMILNILRPRTDQSEDVCLAVHHKYPVESAKQDEGPITQEKLMSILMANEGADLKKTLNPSLIYGPALIEHSLLNAGIKQNARIGKDFHISEDITKLMAALDHADSLMKMAKKCCKGYIIQKKEKKISMKAAEEPDELLTYSEFHPLLFKQHENQSYIELESFDKAVDEFFSKIGSQKLDMKVLQQEKAALKKLEHIKKDHEKRLMSLKQEQDIDMNKGQLIEMNLDLVDRAILIIRSAIANQTDWNEIHTIVKEAQIQGDPVASSIKSLKLDTNHITMFLKNPYLDSDEEESSDNPEAVTPMNVDIDLELSAYGNARKYFDKKRKAAAKEQKTVDASTKALKSAERKTFQTLKEVQTVATINKARKTYWFEKFLWFISSENYVVIGGRDQQQNEFIVKKYLRPGDIYVHADIHGASSVVIKNPSGEPIPPKTLNEAGTMALCNSAAWDARVVTSAWWVYHHQVSKTAPTGEYLTTGSFMIRGKKNFLPPSYLVYGFGFLFKIDEDSLFRHKGERRVRSTDDEVDMKAESETMESEVTPQSKHADPQSGQNTNSSSDSEIHSDDATNVDGSRSGNNMVEERTSTIKEDTEENELPKSVREMSLQSDNKSEIVLSSATNQSGSDHQESKAREESSSDGIKTSKLEEDTLNDSDMSDEGNLFPDTNIELQYTKGEKFQIQLSRMVSSQSTAADGDIEADAARPTSANKCGAKLSAKQRRELRKKRAKEVQKQSTGPETEVELSSKTLDQEQAGPSTHSQKQVKTKQQSLQEGSQPQPTVLKRGQKSKLKKIKEKYKDQDEGERELRMKILASAGPSKEDKKKAKKGKQQGHSLSAPNKKQPQGQGQKVHPGRKLTIEDIKEESAIITQDFQGEKAKTEEDLSDEEKQVLLEEENIQIGQEMNELDLLTGMPVPEDVLHFCIPVCAPYSAILNYKFKVKLTPGTTKRGKAAKAALHSFMSDKNTTNREKDLFKSLKDVDLSRNIPGKVKVSAPNLLKYKKK